MKPNNLQISSDETRTDVNSSSGDGKRDSLRGELRSVGRHSLIYLVGPAFSSVVGFILIPIYTRFIDQSLFGVMSLVDVVMTLTMMLLSLGFSDGMTRFYYDEHDEQKRRRLLTTVILGPALVGLPVIVGLILVSASFCQWLGLDMRYIAYLRLAFLTAWFSMLVEIGYTYIRMRYQSRTFVVLTAFQILVSVTLNLWLVIGLRLGIWGILYSTAIVQGTLACFLTGRILWQSWAWPTLGDFRRLVGFGLHLVPSTVSLQLSNYLNPLMLRWLLIGEPTSVLAQVGLFAAGQKIGVIVNRFVTVPFHAFWRPRRMELVIRDNDEVRHILAKMCTYSTLMTAQVALLIAVSAQDLLRLLFVEGYWDAYRVVPWIAAAYVVLGLEHHFGTGMHYAKRTTWATPIGLVALSALVFGNLFVIPRFGFAGAAAMSLVATTIRSGLFLVVSQRYYRLPFELHRLIVIGAAAVLLFGLANQISISQPIPSLLARVALASALLPLLGSLRFFSSDEIDGVRRLANRFRMAS